MSVSIDGVTMSHPGLDKLGRIFMERVRDAAIVDWDQIIDGQMKGANAQALHERLAGFQAEHIDVLRSLIPEIVDDVLHHLLWTLEREHDVRIAVKTPAGELTDAAAESDGLAGELPSDQGWIARFSQQRHSSHC